jgi:hypothetical protein
VDDGCRAEFLVDYGSRNDRYYDDDHDRGRNDYYDAASSELSKTTLLALIDDASLRYFHSGQEWLEQARQQAGAIRVYNQHPQALEAVEALPAADGERRIEIFQDTEGVFGLRAWQVHGKLQQPVALEFAD